MKTVGKFISRILIILIASILFPGCGGDKKENGNNSNIPKPEKMTYDVEYTENTTVVKENVMESFISSDKASGIYKFSSDADELLNLKPGEIVFFYGNSVRKIKSVAEQGNEIIVNTEYVTLNKVIKNGTIGWETKIDWSSDQPEVQNASLLLGDAVFVSETSSGLKIHETHRHDRWPS